MWSSTDLFQAYKSLTASAHLSLPEIIVTECTVLCLSLLPGGSISGHPVVSCDRTFELSLSRS